MKRIIIHHTAGGYTPNSTDLKAYHYCINDKGIVYTGKFRPVDNENCKDGKYAAHTLQGNTGSIGIAACCNYNFNSKQPDTCKYPLTQKQFEAICKLCAQMCIKYNIDLKEVTTHYEFDKIHSINQGKVDITYLPFKPELKPDAVASYFRSKVYWYLQNLTNS